MSYIKSSDTQSEVMQKFNKMFTGDPAIVEANNLHDIFKCTERVEFWRRGHDLVYRLFTSSDTRELNECMLGLISSGQKGMKIGLLRSKYSARTDVISVKTVNMLDVLENEIMESNLSMGGELHRVSCHFIILVALVMEPDFVQYTLLKTHDRDKMRYYINDVLREELFNLLKGASTHGSVDERDLFELSTFVRKGRHFYAIYCMPTPLMTTV